MQRNNKQFVYTMIITTVIGFIVLMIVMLWGVNYISGNGSGSGARNEESTQRVNVQEKEKQKERTSYTTDILVLVTNIKVNEITVLDINNNQKSVKKLTSDIKVVNEHGKIMPLVNIKEGDIVKLVYEPNQDKIIEIHMSDEIWEMDNVVSDAIDFSSRIVTIDEKVYHYVDYVFVQDEKGKRINIDSLGQYDKLYISGVENKIWSIKVLEKQARLSLGELPTLEGTLEINWNTMIPLEQIGDPIPIPAGKNKILLSMKGYKPIAKEIIVKPGETYEFLADDVKKSYSKLRVVVTNTAEEYFINIDNKTYSWDRTIELEHGDYAIEVTATGHKPWRGRVLLEQEIVTLKVALEPLESETSTSESTSTNSETQTSQGNKLKTVNVDTEPKGADVFIKGVKQGQTPIKMNLPVGSYTITFSKEGYETYTTTILVDETSTSHDYFYMLIVKQQ